MSTFGWIIPNLIGFLTHKKSTLILFGISSSYTDFLPTPWLIDEFDDERGIGNDGPGKLSVTEEGEYMSVHS
jgi:hypothetical protein